jgi:uncharacterized repeat protein (TIGR04138 family)
MPGKEPSKSLEQIVAEVGSFPIDAFVFIQECIGLAATHVHGPMSEDETTVAKWMAHRDMSLDQLREMAESETLPPDIAKALARIGGPDELNRHVTGQELCWAIRDVALERWGLMARTVMNRFNLRTTEDFGKIVFALVENGWLQKQPTDSISDFNNVFTFDEAFDRGYRMTLE